MNAIDHSVEGLDHMMSAIRMMIANRVRPPDHAPSGRSSRAWLPAIALAASLPIGLAPQSVRGDVVVVDVVAVAQGMRAAELRGKPVVNEQGQRIGAIDDLIIGQDRVLFAILQIGGFLGIGSKLVAVPYNSLQITPGAAKIVLPGASKSALEHLPEFKYRV
jgi:sporulation protein YlmC with PRC-barrel domain